LVLCAGLFATTLGASLMVIDPFSFSRPFWDQWFEGMGLFEPFRRGSLSWAVLFAPHNEHRILPSRLEAIALFALDGFWDNRVQATANAVLHALTATGVAWVLLRRLPLGLAVPSVLGLGLLWSLPLARENIVWGFQSQFYWLLLFALLALWLLTDSEERPAGWFLGWFCGLLALLSLGDGPLVPVALLGALGLECWRQRDRLRTLGRPLTLAAALLVLGLWLAGGGQDQGLRPHSLRDFFTSAGRVLAYPFSNDPWVALPVWAPWVSWLVTRLRSPTSWSSLDRFLAALGLFVLLHAPAIAFARGLGGAGPATRYFDILALGLVANLVGLFRVLAPTSRRWAVPVMVGWCAMVGVGVRAVSLKMWKDELPASRIASLHQDWALEAYGVSGDPQFLRVSRGSDLPYPDAAGIERFYAEPFIRAILPGHLHGVQAPLETSVAGGFAVHPPAAPLVEERRFVPWYVEALSEQGRFQAQLGPVDADFVQFRVSGTAHAVDRTLRLVGQGQVTELTLPDAAGRPGWVRVTGRTPRGPWRIEAAHGTEASGWSLSAPATVGPLTGVSEALLRHGVSILGVGIAGIALGLLVLATAYTTERRNGRTTRLD
jgi:hypothetical protein